MNGEIDMRQFARGAGAGIRIAAGNVLFARGEPGECMYIIQSGTIEMMIGDT